MDWDAAIKRHSEALNRIVAALFALLGLEGEADLGRIPNPLYRSVLLVLRPANLPCAASLSSRPRAWR